MLNLHDPVMTPQDRIPMEILSGVKPEAISLFSPNPCAPVPVDVGLNSPLSPSYISQELEIQFVMRPLKDIAVRHLQHHQK